MTLLGNETTGGTGEIKNNAFFTPIAGTLSTVRDYFRGGSTPISQTCQRNFVMLATDGNPTGRTDGNQYDPSEWQNTQNAGRRLDLRPGPARRLRPADARCARPASRAATTTSRPTSSAWATRSPTRARSPR